MSKYRFLSVWLCSLVLAAWQGKAEVTEMVRYIRIDINTGSGYMYDENFVPFPDAKERPRTSAEYFPEDRSIWILGLTVDVVRRLEDGRIEVKSNDPRYAKLPHHVVFSYVDGIKPPTDVAGQRPIALGNELTDADFPPPYAYQIRGGHWYIWDWHWHNLGGVPISDEVYVRLTLTVDDEDAGYRDTNATWVDAVPVSAEFCVPYGEFVYEGQPYRVGDFSGEQRIRAVAVLPHIHDHGTSLQLVRNDEIVQEFVSELDDSFSYHISHGGCRSTGWHQHEGHLITKGLNAAVWTPGADGPVFEPEDRLWSRSFYDTPHESMDGMGILVTYWEAIK